MYKSSWKVTLLAFTRFSLMADLYVAGATVQGLQEACGLFSLLATMDTVRAKAWMRRAHEAEASLQKARAADME